MRSPSREAFLARMTALELASRSQDLQTQTLVAADGDPSRLLRNGLTVVGFAAFEDFFNARTQELLQRIDPAKVPFSKLPQKLQAASTWGALQTLAFRARLDKDPASRLALIQDHAGYVASTASAAYMLSPLSFAPQGSNLSADDIEAAFKALLVDAPWIQLTDIASRAGYGALGLGEVLKSSAGNRHLAAHLAAADMALSDVQELATKLRVVALAVDTALVLAVMELPQAIARGKQKIENLSKRVLLRFVEPSGGRIRVIKEGVSRADRVMATLDEAISYALPLAEKRNEVLVVRDHQGLPISWFTP